MALKLITPTVIGFLTVLAPITVSFATAAPHF